MPESCSTHEVIFSQYASCLNSVIKHVNLTISSPSFRTCIFKNPIHSTNLSQITTQKSKATFPQESPRPNKPTTNAEDETCLISPQKKKTVVKSVSLQAFFFNHSEPLFKSFPQGIGGSSRSTIASKCSPDTTHLLGVSVGLFFSIVDYEYLQLCRNSFAYICQDPQSCKTWTINFQSNQISEGF